MLLIYFILYLSVIVSKSSFTEEKNNYSSVTNESLVIQTLSGKVRGLKTKASTGKEVDQWLGIPYAEKPLGELRFRHPKAVNSWEDILNATENPNSCIQNLDIFGNFSQNEMWEPNTPVSEDCLYLSITVPKPRPSNATVMIWIHGGGYSTGTSTLEIYDPKVLASEENVIVVGIQYRLTSLGFLYFGTNSAPGNAGLFDQLLAIRWIHENIASFGGDSNKITLFGESAGASSVSIHLISPLSKNSISRGILQSGAVTAPWSMLELDTILSYGLKLARNVGCPSNGSYEKIVQCLYTVDAMTLVASEPYKNLGVAKFPFGPVIDNNLITDDPKYKCFTNRSILAGFNSDEGFYFLFSLLPDLLPLQENVLLNRTQFLEAIDKIYPTESNISKHALAFQYTDWLDPDNPVSYRDAIDKIVGDPLITCPIYEFVDKFAETGANVYMYHFAHRSSLSSWPSWSGVLHACEIEFVFGVPLNTIQNYSSSEMDLSRQMMRYWANFARTGNPNISPDNNNLTISYWPNYNLKEKKYLRLNISSSTVGNGFRVQQCAFWNRYLPEFKRALNL